MAGPHLSRLDGGAISERPGLPGRPLASETTSRWVRVKYRDASRIFPRDFKGHEIQGAAAHLSAGAKYGAAPLCMRGIGADAIWPVLSVTNHEIMIVFLHRGGFFFFCARFAIKTYGEPSF